MSRSKRKTPVFGNCVGKATQKSEKRIANRTLRAKVRQALQYTHDGDECPTLQEVSDVWNWPMDGKRYFPSVGKNHKWMRK